MSKVYIDVEQCINCFDGSDRVPDIFHEDKASCIHVIVHQPTNEDEIIECEDAAYHCPTGAIIT